MRCIEECSRTSEHPCVRYETNRLGNGHVGLRHAERERLRILGQLVHPNVMFYSMVFSHYLKWLAVCLICLTATACWKAEPAKISVAQQASSEFAGLISDLHLDDADPEVSRAIGEACDQVTSQVDSAKAWGNLALLLLAHDHGDAADRALAIAERLAPEDAVWAYLRGKFRITDEPDLPAAILHVERAVAAAPDDVVMRLQLADLLLADGRLSEARGSVRKGIRSSRNATGHGSGSHSRGTR